MAVAAHYRYKKDSLTWTPDGASAIPLTGVQSIRFGQGGEVSDLTSDASELVQEQPLHGIKGRISVTLIAQQHMVLDLGAGVLTFDMERVKSGRGAVSGEDKTVEFSNAVLRDIDGGAGSAPGENVSLSFEAAADDNGDIFTITDEA